MNMNNTLIYPTRTEPAMPYERLLAPALYSEVFNEDCKQGMKRFPDKFFKLAIVDPPYFSGPEKRQYYGQKVSNKGVKRIDYPVTDTWQLPDDEYFIELFRVSEHQIIWGCNYFKWHFESGRIIWDKVHGKSSFSDCEIAYCSKHNTVRLFRYMWNGMMQGKSISEGHIMQGNKKLNEKKIHPTQKPVNLYKWLLREYANEGDNILDTHIGSGSSRLASFDLGFEFTGFELNSIHWQRQELRFKNHIAQQRLL